MTYPKSVVRPRRRRRRRRAEPALPRDRARRRSTSGRPTTPSARRSRNRDGAEEWVFYDGPPFANGLPHYGHLLTGYAKDLFPRFQTMRGKRVRPRLRLGHARPAGRARGDEAARHHREGRDRGDGRRLLQREGARVGARLHARVGGLRHPPGALGRLRARLQDARHRRTWSRVLWAFKTLHDKGLAYEGYRVLPYCWRDETPLSTHELRMDDDVYKMRQDPSVTVTFPLDRAEGRGARTHRACARSRGRPRPGRCPRTSRSPSAPTSATSSCPADPPAPPTCTTRRRPRDDPLEAESHRYLLAEELLPNYAKDLGYEIARMPRATPSSSASSAPTSRTSPTTGSSTTTRMPRPGAPSTRGGSSSTTTSRPATAPASSTRRRPTARTTSGSPRPPASRSS